MILREDRERAAEFAGLRYVNPDEPGYRRRRRGRGFAYYDERGAHIEDPVKKARLQALAIPPAWSDVWICVDERGHVQATGYDDRGRKQYVYHPDWIIVRDRAKFWALPAFGRALPAIRRQVAAISNASSSTSTKPWPWSFASWTTRCCASATASMPGPIQPSA